MSTRVLFLTDCNPAVYSGGRYHAFMMAEAAALGGADVTVWAPAKPIFWNDFSAFPAHGSVKLHLNSFIKRPQGTYDIIVLVPDGGARDIMYREALRIAKRDKARVLFLNFESGNWFNSLALEPRPAAKWDLWLRSCRFADMIISSAAESTKWAREFYVDIPSHAEFVDCNPSINSKAADAVWERGLTPKKRILVVSRFGGASKHKGADDLVSIFSDKNKGYRVSMLAGTGALPPNNKLEEVKRQFEAKGLEFEILHNVTDTEKFEAIAVSRAVVFPTKFEGFGYPPVEAQYLGRPCITYGLPVLREVSGGGAIYAPVGDTNALRKAIDNEIAAPLEPSRAAALRAGIEQVATLDSYAERVGALFRRALEMEAPPAALRYEEDMFQIDRAGLPAIPENLELTKGSLGGALKSVELAAFNMLFRSRVAFLHGLTETAENRDRLIMALADESEMATLLLKTWLGRPTTRPAIEGLIRSVYDLPEDCGEAIETPDDVVGQLAEGGEFLNSVLLELRERPDLQRVLLNDVAITVDREHLGKWLGLVPAPEQVESESATSVSLMGMLGEAEASAAPHVHEALATNQELARALAEYSVRRRTIRDTFLETWLASGQGRSALSRSIVDNVSNNLEFNELIKPLLRKAEQSGWVVQALLDAGDSHRARLVDAILRTQVSREELRRLAVSILESEDGLEILLQDRFYNKAIVNKLLGRGGASGLKDALEVPEGRALALTILLDTAEKIDDDALLSAWRSAIATREPDVGAIAHLVRSDETFAHSILQTLVDRADLAEQLYRGVDKAVLYEWLTRLERVDALGLVAEVARERPDLWSAGLIATVKTPDGAKALAREVAGDYSAALAAARALTSGEAGKAAVREAAAEELMRKGAAANILLRPAVRTAVMSALFERGVTIAEIRNILEQPDAARNTYQLVETLLAMPEFNDHVADFIAADRAFMRRLLERASPAALKSVLPPNVMANAARALLEAELDTEQTSGLFSELIAEFEEVRTSIAKEELKRRPSIILHSLKDTTDMTQESLAHALIDVVNETDSVLSRRIKRSFLPDNPGEPSWSAGHGALKAPEISFDSLKKNPKSTARWARQLSRDGFFAVATEVHKLLKDLKWVLPPRFDAVSFEEDAIDFCERPQDVLPLLLRRLTDDEGRLCLKNARLEYPEGHDLTSLVDEVLRRKAYIFETMNPYPAIIDGGANFGLATFAYLTAFPQAKVIAFEPGRRSLQALQRNVEFNGWDGVEIVPKALAGEIGVATFYEPNSMPMGGSLTRRLADRSFDCMTYDVPKVPLSDFLDGALDLLKLDIEGAESEVIEEIGDRISCARRIFCEVHSTPELSAVIRSGQIADRLEKLGYQCRTAPNHTIATPFSQLNREHSYVLWATRK